MMLWKLLTCVFACLFVVSLLTGGFSGITGATVKLTPEEAGERVITFINILVLRGQDVAELVETGEEDGVYYVKFNAAGRENVWYLSKDGKILSPFGPIDWDEITGAAAAMPSAQRPSQRGGGSAPAPIEVPKSDVPKVELFAMSYCPFGLQAEKGLLPVVDLLGDKADISVKFIHYLMHGEEEAMENTRQYCIQKDFKDKYWDYLTCFAGSGDWGSCLTEVGINKAVIEECVIATNQKFGVEEALASGDQYPRYSVTAEESTGYGVQGSPTLVINGQIVSAGRAPEGIKDAVCAAFNEAPAECEEVLSSETPSPGFGFGGGSAGGAGATGSCG